MRGATLIMLVLYAVALGCACSGALQGGTLDFSTPRQWASIAVKVTNMDGSAIAGARVHVPNDQPGDVFTDCNGGAVIDVIWPAKRGTSSTPFVVYVTAFGYQDGQATVTVTAAETSRLTVSLRDK